MPSKNQPSNGSRTGFALMEMASLILGACNLGITLHRVRDPSLLWLALMVWALWAPVVRAMDAAAPPDLSTWDMTWGVKIPMRDGIHLSATGYFPRSHPSAVYCAFTLTPYVSQTYHERGVYFAAHGLPFLIVDVRGRGNSEGKFTPNLQEANDGYDIVEWLAKQPYCGGKVAMWGGSYAGYDQWVTAAARPPHLATIVPVAAPFIGTDFPFRNNIASPYLLQWLLFTAGHTSQEAVFNDDRFWSRLWLRRFEAGEAYATLGRSISGFDPAALREWIAHPDMDSYWDAYNPTQSQYRALTIPILSITGSYDGDQLGALTHYRAHLRAAPSEQRDNHYLIIGPWDHSATRTPRTDIGGLHFGPASLVDLPKLHLEWYAWTMAGGTKPAFLQKHIAYYVMGADKWRYADSLERVTATEKPYFLHSDANASSIFRSGSLRLHSVGHGPPDSYVFDPRDVTGGAREAEVGIMSQGDLAAFTDQSTVLSDEDHHLVYQTAAFDKDVELSGFFRLSAWISIDQADTDFSATVYELDLNGGSILLSQDVMRARYRESLHSAKLVTTRAPLRYEFNHFTFVSRRIGAGSRLRLVIGPVNSIFMQKNFNSGRPVSEETMADARTVHVNLLHDKGHPSTLFVPFGQPE